MIMVHGETGGNRMATCSDCGKNLKHIRYVRPDHLTLFERIDRMVSPRPPLCKPCWEKAVEKADAEVRAKK